MNISRPAKRSLWAEVSYLYLPKVTLDDSSVTSYIVKPTETTKTAVFLLHDAFGFRMPNIRRIADRVAAQTGFISVVPDLLNNDAAPEDLSSFDIVGWLGRHTEKEIDPIVGVVLQEVVTEYGVEKFGAMGYCLGVCNGGRTWLLR